MDEYCPNGQPSKKKIEYETVNGVIRTLQKGSGMIDGTIVSNFPVHRGGYRCRHEVKFTFSTKSSKDIAKSIIDSLD